MGSNLAFDIILCCYSQCFLSFWSTGFVLRTCGRRNAREDCDSEEDDEDRDTQQQQQQGELPFEVSEKSSTSADSESE